MASSDAPPASAVTGPPGVPGVMVAMHFHRRFAAGGPAPGAGDATE